MIRNLLRVRKPCVACIRLCYSKVSNYFWLHSNVPDSTVWRVITEFVQWERYDYFTIQPNTVQTRVSERGCPRFGGHIVNQLPTRTYASSHPVIFTLLFLLIFQMHRCREYLFKPDCNNCSTMRRTVWTSVFQQCASTWGIKYTWIGMRRYAERLTTCDHIDDL